MNRDTVIRLAREAGFVVDELSRQHQPNCIQHTWHLIDEGLERFAALVAAAERETCAKVVWSTPSPADEYVSLRDAIAAAIRSRT